MLTLLRQRFWTATVSASRYGLSASTIHNRLWKKSLSHQCGEGQTMTRSHRLAYVQWARRHFIWRCVDWNRVSFSGVTRFAPSNAGGKTHKQALLGLLRAGKGSIWLGAVSWFGVEKWVTRRRSLLSCKTISMHYIDDVLCPHAIPFLHYFYT